MDQSMNQNHKRYVVPLLCGTRKRYDASLVVLEHLLPVLHFTICIMVTCRVFCHDNKIRRTYSCSLLGTQVEVYDLAMISHDFLSKVLEFRAEHKISRYTNDLHPCIMNPCIRPLQSGNQCRNIKHPSLDSTVDSFSFGTHVSPTGTIIKLF